VSVVCCQVEFYASGRYLFQRSPTECGVSECDHESLIIRRSWSLGSCAVVKKSTSERLMRNSEFRSN
jgi:hypothetical protein